MPWVEIINRITKKPTGFFLWEGPCTNEVRDMVLDAITRPPVHVAVRRPPSRHVGDVDTPPTATTGLRPPADDPFHSRVPFDENTTEPPITTAEDALFEEDEAPIEDTPGYLGIVFDGDFLPGPELAVLGDFDWHTYEELVDGARQLILSEACGLGCAPACDLDLALDAGASKS